MNFSKMYGKSNIYFQIVFLVFFVICETNGQLRISRQASKCKADEFQCKFTSGCILQTQVCDGQNDCSDNSDESFTLCSHKNFTCPEFAFRCSYGACTKGDAKCNGDQDCADLSDELLKECPGVKSTVEKNNCKEDEFPCLSGDQCVQGHRRCDGFPDCDDGTDETITECSLIECEPFTFRCAYGACVAGDARCDGNSQCRDGSDELAPECTFSRPAATPIPLVPTTQPPNVPVFYNNKTTTERPRPNAPVNPKLPSSGKKCKLPPQPVNGFYSSFSWELGSDDIRNQDTEVPSGISLQFGCNTGFGVRGKSDVVCRFGQWFPEIPFCSDQCEPLYSRKLHIICFTPRGELTRCDKPLPSNSTATFFCNPSTYMKIKEPEYKRINCRNGLWDRPLVDDFCHAECGRPVSNLAQPAVANGKQTEYGEFPWHAGIYEFNSTNSSYDQICGGTLISHKVVVSAAHCFSEEIKELRRIYIKDFSTIKIGLGKYYRTLNSSDDDLAQIVDVEKIEFSPQYQGDISLYADDIAFITLKTEVEYTRTVRPVCIDVGKDSFEEDQLIKGAMGKVVGWGLTIQQEFSETLILAEMPFVPRDECITKITNTLLRFVSRDKICAGDRDSKVSVCPGDSGGGLVFEEPKSKAYYLRGVVSLGTKGCKGQEFALFTKLSSHRELVEKYLRLP